MSNVSPNLPDLPVELLNRIAFFINKGTASSLALVCRAVTASATDVLWRDMDLSQADLRETTGRYRMELQNEAQTQRIHLRRRMEAVLKQGLNEERGWKTVKSLILTVRLGSIQQLSQLLQQTSTSVRSLKIDRAGIDGPHAQATLEPCLLNCRVEAVARGLTFRFTCLTYLRIGFHAIRFIETVLLLCQISPNLTTLDFHVSDIQGPNVEPNAGPIFHYPTALVSSTKIEYLRIEYDSYDYEDVVPPRAQRSALSLISLLERSPKIIALSLKLSKIHNALLCDLAIAVSKLPLLSDMTLAVGTAEEGTDEEDTGAAVLHWVDMDIGNPGYPSLRRLVMDHSEWGLPSAMDDSYPQIPKLQIVVLDCCIRDIFGREPLQSRVHPFTHNMARWIRKRPQLRYIYSFQADPIYSDVRTLSANLDQLEKSGRPSGRIYSIRHGTEELLHASLMVVAVRYDVLTRDGPSKHLGYILDTATGDDYDLGQHALLIRGASYRSYTNYNDLTVPMEVIDRMKAVEGDQVEGYWENRGVEVGRKSWDILTTWASSQ